MFCGQKCDGDIMHVICRYKPPGNHINKSDPETRNPAFLINVKNPADGPDVSEDAGSTPLYAIILTIVLVILLILVLCILILAIFVMYILMKG